MVGFAKSLIERWHAICSDFIKHCSQGMLTSLLRPLSCPEGLPRGVNAASEGVVGVPGSDPDSPLLKRAFTSDLARRSRSAAPENKPAQHATSQTAALWKQCLDSRHAK